MSQDSSALTRDFSTLFAKLDEEGNVTIVRLARELSEQEETIEMIAAAMEEIEHSQSVTYWA